MPLDPSNPDAPSLTPFSDAFQPVLDRLHTQVGLRITGTDQQARIDDYASLKNGGLPRVVFCPDTGVTGGPEHVGESPRTLATYAVRFDCHCVAVDFDKMWLLVQDVYTACRDVFAAMAAPEEIEFFPPSAGISGWMAVFQVSMDIDLKESIFDRQLHYQATATTALVTPTVIHPGDEMPPPPLQNTP
jgi:hypothetical protein